GLPVEGALGPDDFVGHRAERSVPTCLVTERLADLAPRMGDAEIAIVLNENDVVMGLLRRETLDLDPTTGVADLMQPGPSTFRPSMTVTEGRDYATRNDLPRLLITTMDGAYVGVIDTDRLKP